MYGQLGVRHDYLTLLLVTSLVTMETTVHRSSVFIIQYLYL